MDVKTFDEVDAKNSDDVNARHYIQIFDTISEIDPFVLEVVLELCFNLHIFPKDTKKALVYVCGKIYEFSLTMINKKFRTSSVTWHKNSEVNRVTMRRHDLVKYLSKGKATSWNEFRAYLMLNVLGNLHPICCMNWIPSTNNMMGAIDRCKLVNMLEHKGCFSRSGNWSMINLRRLP